MTSTRRGRLIAAVSVLAVLVMLVLTRPAERRPNELGADGTGPNGLGVIATVLDETGVDVDERREAAEPDDVLFVAGHVAPGEQQREEIVAHLEAGGRAVVVGTGVDRDELRQEGFVPFGLDDRRVEAACDDPRFAGVQAVDTITNDRLVADPGDLQCFRDDGQEPGDPSLGLLLVAETDEPGDLVLLADDAFLRNADVATADNAALAARLLTPTEPGAGLVVLETAPDVDADVFAFVGGRFWATVAWLSLVFVLYAARRSRRLGPPVAEQVPVVVEGAALVLAVGGLLARTGDRVAAAEDLRERLRADLAPRLGVAADDPERLLAAVEDAATGMADTGVDPATLERALGREPPGDDTGLLAIARAVAATRAALAPRPSSAADPTTSTPDGATT